MESPASWGLPEKAVSQILGEQENILPQFLCGMSLERQITDALRAEGLLREEPEEVKMLLKVRISRKKGLRKIEETGFIDPGGRHLAKGDTLYFSNIPWIVLRVDEMMPEGEVPRSQRLDRAW